MIIVGVLVYNDILFMPLARKFLLSPQETAEVMDESHNDENKPLLESE